MTIAVIIIIYTRSSLFIYQTLYVYRTSDTLIIEKYFESASSYEIPIYQYEIFRIRPPDRNQLTNIHR